MDVAVAATVISFEPLPRPPVDVDGLARSDGAQNRPVRCDTHIARGIKHQGSSWALHRRDHAGSEVGADLVDHPLSGIRLRTVQAPFRKRDPIAAATIRLRVDCSGAEKIPEVNRIRADLPHASKVNVDGLAALGRTSVEIAGLGLRWCIKGEKTREKSSSGQSRRSCRSRAHRAGRNSREAPIADGQDLAIKPTSISGSQRQREVVATREPFEQTWGGGVR